ncbi:C10 family peptidase [Tenacibaculum piscium]|uniref:Spi protease inhibitor domain-containing protein n=1 Tax=Tenacibaculum piscium TaxID=1458515 RepID=A0A2H1YJJ6_9FLAO|nr:C10 family peptidase [Tenacibaculum piscium]MBE7628790.1 hypothetical protein [Tenacibaculum piscium]MBE7669929.1 hypothetical protein [Tenacibaculum piscium]SOS75580.1 hypothetical protein TNO020_440367 [Tenacibaculum piscium]
MKNKTLLTIFTIFFLFIFFSCENEDHDLTLHNKDNVNINNSTNKVKNALSFLNTNFVSQSNLSARGLAKKGNLQEYSEDKIRIIHELNDEDGTPLLKLICFEDNGYILISNLENVPNPPVLFYSEEKFDKEDVNPALIRYIEEFLATHTKDGRFPTEDEDQNGDGSWDDGRDTNGSGDPRDSPYYYVENEVKRWTETIQKGPLLNTFWRQGSPYNKSCPKINGKNALVGCVAIAVGQIMNYNRKSRKNYNWDKINVNINESGELDTNHLANFLYDIGKEVKMDYGLTASSSNISRASLYFGRAGYNQKLYDYNYNTVKKSIDNNKPVYLRAASEKKGIWFIFRWGWKYTGGHAWVADGYKTVKHMKKIKIDNGNKNGGISYANRTSSTSEYIHMNWGWGKGYQSTTNGGGWCTYNYFKAPDNDETNYQYKKQMIIY